MDNREINRIMAEDIMEWEVRESYFVTGKWNSYFWEWKPYCMAAMEWSRRLAEGYTL